MIDEKRDFRGVDTNEKAPVVDSRVVAETLPVYSEGKPEDFPAMKKKHDRRRRFVLITVLLLLLMNFASFSCGRTAGLIEARAMHHGRFGPHGFKPHGMKHHDFKGKHHDFKGKHARPHPVEDEPVMDAENVKALKPHHIKADKPHHAKGERPHHLKELEHEGGEPFHPEAFEGEKPNRPCAHHAPPPPPHGGFFETLLEPFFGRRPEPKGDEHREPPHGSFFEAMFGPFVGGEHKGHEVMEQDEKFFNKEFNHEEKWGKVSGVVKAHFKTEKGPKKAHKKAPKEAHKESDVKEN